MDIRSHLSILQNDPKAYHTLGVGAHSWGVVHPEHRDEVLLLERPLRCYERKVEAPCATTRKAHARSVQFSKKYDRYLEDGLVRPDGGRYSHSSLLDSIDPVTFGNPITLRLDAQTEFSVHSARLVKRIQGRPIHPMELSDPQAALHNQNKQNSLAQDIARWLFTVHHSISPRVMDRYKIEKQFVDVGASITQRFRHYEKFQLFVTKNIKDINKLKIMIKGQCEGHDEGQDKWIAGWNRNLSAVGLDISLVERIAETIGNRLETVLQSDRIGLAHTDVHLGNVITDSTHTNVNGVCDWSSGTITLQSFDFSGLGMGKGLLPKVVACYGEMEDINSVDRPVKKEAIYGLSIMRQTYFMVKMIKNTSADNEAVPFIWQQIGESLREIAKIEPRYYEGLVQAFEAQPYAPPIIPATYGRLTSQPELVA